MAYPNHSFVTVLLLPIKQVLGVITGKTSRTPQTNQGRGFIKRENSGSREGVRAGRPGRRAPAPENAEAQDFTGMRAGNSLGVGVSDRCSWVLTDHSFPSGGAIPLFLLGPCQKCHGDTADGGVSLPTMLPSLQGAHRVVRRQQHSCMPGAHLPVLLGGQARP